MTEQEIQSLGEKIKNETSTPEEELQLLQFLNQGVSELRTFVQQVMTEQHTSEITNPTINE